MKISVTLCILLLTAGCVAAPELTPEQVTQINVLCKDNATCIVEQTDDAMRRLLEDIEYDRQEKRDIEHDKLCALMLSCKAVGAIMFNVKRMGRVGKSAHIDRYGECKISKRDRLYDYQCVSKNGMRDWLRRY